MASQENVCDARGEESILEWVDSVADRFEHDWSRETPPEIGKFLGQSSGDDRATLLVELVQIDFACRVKAGDRISVGDYFDRFPELHALDEPTRHSLILYARRIEGADSSRTQKFENAESKRTPQENAEDRDTTDVNTPQRRILGKFELLDLLGEGTFGSVYRAKDVELGRIVAVKVPRAAAFNNPAEKERFLREARSAAGLRHPRIVPVLEIAHEGDMPYLVSAFIDGETLREYAVQKNLTFRQSAEMIARVAEALDHAHNDGVIHRDIKPGNILVDGDGEPHLTDFGLAKSTAADASMTVEGQVLGAPAYMSPEQARGDSASADARSDVYGLGVVLYELLTGERPFQGNVRMLLLQVLNDEPRPPRRLNDGIPRDLETICLKAMSKIPADRYSSAAELVADLRRFLNGEPILARPISWIPRGWRWCRRNPLVAGLTTAIALAMMVGTAVSLHFAVRSQRSAKESAEQTKLAERESIIRELQLHRLSGRTNGWRGVARGMIANAAEIRIDDELRNHAVPTLRGIDVTFERRFGQPGVSGATSVAFDSEGRRLLFGGLNDRARVYDVATGDVIPPEGINAPNTGIGPARKTSASEGIVGNGPVAFRPDGTPVELVMSRPTKSKDSTRRFLVLRTVPGRKVLKTFSMGSESGVDLNNSKNQFQWATNETATVVAASVRRTDGAKIVWVWNVDAKTSRPMHELTPRGRGRGGAPPTAEKPDSRLAVSPDGSLLAAANSSGEITVWSIADGKIVAELKSAAITIHSLLFHQMIGKVVTVSKRTSSEQRWMLAAGDSGGIVTIWDVTSRIPISRCHGASVSVYALAFVPDGTLLASAGRSAIRLWDVATGRLIQTIGNPAVPKKNNEDIHAMLDYILDLAFSPDGQRLAAVANPSSRRDLANQHVWTFEYGRGISTLRGLTGRVPKAVFSPSGDRLAALSFNWQVGIWDCRTGSLLRLLDVPEGYYPDNTGLAFDADGRRFAFSTGTQATLWDIDANTVLQSWPELPPGMGDNLAFDKAGRLILVRFETRNRPVQPFTQSKEERHQNPFICRARDLLSTEPYEWFSKSRGFQDIREITISGDGKHYAAREVVKGEPKRRDVFTVFSTESGKEVWHVHSRGCRLDATGRYVVLSEGVDGEQLRLREFSTGRIIPQKFVAGGIIGPPGGLLAAGQYRPTGAREVPPMFRVGTTILKQSETKPLFTVGIDDEPPISTVVFRRDGEAFAWSDGLGRVYFCDVQRVLRNLEALGLNPRSWSPPK